MDWDAVRLEGPDVTAAMQQLMAEHYESWVSEKIPALDGRAPLEAVHDSEGLEKVRALLIDADGTHAGWSLRWTKRCCAVCASGSGWRVCPSERDVVDSNGP